MSANRRVEKNLVAVVIDLHRPFKNFSFFSSWNCISILSSKKNQNRKDNKSSSGYEMLCWVSLYFISWLCHKFIDIDNRDWSRKSLNLKIFHHFQLCHNIINAAEDVFFLFSHRLLMRRVIVIMCNSFRNVFQFVFSSFTAYSRTHGKSSSRVGSVISITTKRLLKAIKRRKMSEIRNLDFFFRLFWCLINCEKRTIWISQITWMNTKLFNVNVNA